MTKQSFQSAPQTHYRRASCRRLRTALMVAAAAAMLVTGATTNARAAIVGVVPDVVFVAPPADVSLDQTESDVEIKAFDERQCFIPAAAIVTDGGFIPAAAFNTVSCHMLHLDPVEGTPILDGKARFDGDIIGVISRSTLLDVSDAVCEDGVTYPLPGAEPFRGLEAFQANDRYRLTQPDTIQVQMDVPSFSDQVRVITCCPGYNCDPAGGILP